MARKPRISPPDRDGDGKPGGSLPGNLTVPEAIGPEPEAPVVPAPTPSDIPGLVHIENHKPGTRVHLGGGRCLAFGDSADVEPDVASFLRERDQVR